MMRLCIMVVMMLPSFGFGQTHKISGTVSDEESGEKVSYATVYFIRSQQGTTTDVNGYFEITLHVSSDSMILSSVGYETKKFFVASSISGWKISMKASAFEIGDITIVAGGNPADAVVRNIIRNRDEHNKDNLQSYQCEVYNKLEFDLNHVSEKMQHRKILKPFSFVFSNMDTLDGNPTLPMMMTETISDFYFQRNPSVKKEVVTASKVSGMDNESIAQFTGTMYQDINVYNNFINLFDVNFVSPFNSKALFFYRYYIIDSTLTDNGMSYQLKFKPRRPSEPTFEGIFWVNMNDFAITQIDMSVNAKANINFMSKLSITQHFDLVNESFWMLSDESLTIDFKMPKKMVGVVGKKFTSYKNFKINQEILPDEFETARSIEYHSGVLGFDDQYWAQHRHVELTEHQQQIYSMMDSLQHSAAYKTYYRLLNTFGTGYLTVNKFEIGPFYNFYSYSTIEGSRLRFGARTSNDFSKRLMIFGYGAYGLSDRQWKYSGGLLYMLSKTPRETISFDVKKDFEFSGNEFTDFGSDNVWATFFRRDLPQKFVMMQSEQVQFEKEWNTGFSSKFSLTHKDVLPYFDYTFIPEGEPLPLHNQTIGITEAGYSARFAYQEKFYTGEFIRTSFGSKYPIVELKYSIGLNKVMDSQLKYHKLTLDISDRFKIPYIGETEYQVTAGKIFGTLPTPALFNARGNETYYYNPLSFTGINNYQFVSDEFVSAFVTQHLGGFLFNKIPAVRKLKWRSLLTGKLLYGDMSAANRTANAGNSFVVPNAAPYLELGTGIENIFRFFRVDAFWRMTYLDVPGATPFGVRGSFQLSF